VDRFGNLITNFSVAGFDAMVARPFEMRAGRRRITAHAQSYADGKPGELLLVAGSAGYFEIASNQGSAAKLTGRAAGAKIKLLLR
jgi:S-adenosylmethionine hydrolase